MRVSIGSLLRPTGRGARRKRVAQGVTLSLVGGTLAVLAIAYDGSPIHDVDLNDGGVWVTNADIGMMARLNSQVGELEQGVVTTSTTTAVFQEAASVQAYDDGGGGGAERSLAAVDVLAGTAAPVPMPPSFEASAGRSTVVVLDDATGRVWVRRADRLEGFDGEVPTTKVSGRSSVVVTKSGAALVLDRAERRATTWTLDQAGQAIEGTTFEFDDDVLDDPVLSAVGEVPVVLQGDDVLMPGHAAVTVEGEGATLQQPGPRGDAAYLATETGLWSVPLDGGDPEQVAAPEVDGTPAAPAVVAGCVNAAWNDPGTHNYQRLCGGADPFIGEISPLTDASVLVFRSNRDVVVLNDIANGTSWMVQEDGLTRVDNWESIRPDAKDPQEAKVQDRVTDRNDNQPPKAENDEFGARPNATVILPVTLNDIDPDGDILTLKQPPAAKNGATFSVVGEGTQVQVKVPPNASGVISFDYEITDGHPENQTDKATVRLTVHDEGTDEQPELIDGQRNVLTVAAGHQASLNVLPAWIDPEGDSLALVAAESDGGEVGFRPDGTIDFTDRDEGAGVENIRFKVRGGDEVAEGVVEVKVDDVADARPQAVADHFTGVVGSTILLEPMRNDIDPLGGQLTLPSLKKVYGDAATFPRDTARGTATFKAGKAGTYYLEYVATSANGRSSDKTLIRVDVRPATGTNQPPVATRDVAAVRPDGSVLVDVLANDSDPDGDVLVVQGVEVPQADAGVVKASLINKRFVRVEVTGDIEGKRPEIAYLLSDGRSDQVRGAIAVTRADRGKNRRPLAVEDIVTARAGTVIDIPVLENDTDPDGDKLAVDQQSLQDLGADPVISERQVPIVANGTSVRILVPDDGTRQLQFTYGAHDSEGATADTRVVLNIKPDNADDNQAPRPRPIEDRTVTGQAIRVPVSAFGADPDGDPVVFTALVEPPKIGRILRSGADWFEYEPFEGDNSTGTDSFKIQVSDPYGVTATADVRIGVAPRSIENQAPAALGDDVLVKPGLTINYPVLQNDSDPDGDALIMDAAAFQQLADPSGDSDGSMELDGTTVRVDVPSVSGNGEVAKVAEYVVTDGIGGYSSALLTVTARKDAPDHAPLAQDDVAGGSLMRGKLAGDTIDVDVLANDGDLDGSKDELELTAVDEGVARVEGRKLRITLAKDSQVVPYRVTDRTDQSSFGFVYVAGTDNMPPTLDSENLPVEVTAGKKQTIALDDVVVVRAGRSPRIARADQITSAHGDTEAVGTDKLEFVAPKSYYGPASVTLDVLDGKGLNDPDALQAQLTIPITVLPAENVAPTVRSTSVVVFAGGDPVTVDLERLATDLNKDDRLDFEVAGAGDDLETRIDDNVLTIKADDGAPSDEVDLTVAADDGKIDKPVTGRIRVTVIGGDDAAAAQPLMRLRELEVPDAEVGKPVEVDLGAAVLDDPIDEANEVVEVTAAGGDAPTPSVAGTTLRITPKTDGEIVVSYTMDDGSGLVERRVSSRVLITVAGPPDKPNPPRGVEGGPSSVQLTWFAPDDNGSPITGYIVRWDGGSQDCKVTQCVIEGLDPGESYRFTVAAVNALAKDGGPESDPSAPITPDEVPEQMTAPVVLEKFEDRNGKLHLTWTPPENTGSEITGYVLRSSPATTEKKTGPDERSLVWDGLENGTSYTFTIHAVNKRGDGPESPPSEDAIPFTKPSAVAQPSLAVDPPDDKANGHVTVTWPALVAPGNGWDEVSSYDVKLLADGAEVTTVQVAGDSAASTFSRDFEDVENGKFYSAQVRATNRAGTSDEWSQESDRKLSWDKATAPTGVSKVSDCVGCGAATDRYVGEVRFTTPSDNGGAPVHSYRIVTGDGRTTTSDAPTQAEGASTTLQVPFNGTTANQKVTITPITTPEGMGPQEGASGSSGNEFSPYAQPFPPSKTQGSTNEYMHVTVGWNGGNGNGRPVLQTQFQDAPAYSGAGSGTRAAAGDSVGIATDQGGVTKCIQARARTEAGWSAWSGNICGTARERQVFVYFEQTTAIPSTDCYRPCYYTKFRVEGFKAGSYSATRYGRGPGACEGPSGGSWTINVGSNGMGGVGSTNKWWISSSCNYDDVTVGGITQRGVIP